MRLILAPPHTTEGLQKSIPLTLGFSAVVDEEDYERIAAFKWQTHFGRNTVYARRTKRIGLRALNKKKIIYLHQFILGLDGIHVDHHDGNGLNCLRSNLRPCTNSQNLANSRARRSDGVKGITLHKKTGKWLAQITCNYQHRYLGLFVDKQQAADAYDKAALEAFGPFALLNGKGAECA